MSNISNLSNHRVNGDFNFFEIRMVVQDANYEEMKAFVELGLKNHVDLIRFTRIRNYGTYSKEEFLVVGNLDENGKLKEGIRNVLMDPIFELPQVCIEEFKKLL